MDILLTSSGYIDYKSQSKIYVVAAAAIVSKVSRQFKVS